MSTQEVRIRSLELAIQFLSASNTSGNVFELAAGIEQFINGSENAK